MSDGPLPPAIRRLARAAVPDSWRPRARELAQRRGWVAPPPSPDDDPFAYPFREIMSRTSSLYPHYLWGTMCAAELAAGLGYGRISVIEFGVAGGNGLLELERHASWVQKRSGVTIDVIGFDSGTGLPPPQDYRDLPNLWREGYFAMDVERLQAQLHTARLQLGPVSQTVQQLIADRPAPIGFISFDLDLYSSTMDAFGLFDADDALLLPRVVSYFDDVIGFSHSDFTGERLAISEFNDAHPERKLSQLYGLRWVVEQELWWTEQMYMLHCFDHPRYNEPDGTHALRELPLLDR
jgi:hypothetical protein